MTTSLVNLEGRAKLRLGDRLVDVATASNGRFGSDPMQVVGQWAEFRSWAAGLASGVEGIPVEESKLRQPIPRPEKVFAVALNYTDHAREAGLDLPKEPLIFTKFPSCLVGPCSPVTLSSNRVDWEVELVVVIGTGGRNISAERALDHVAGYCVGQDISDRRMQFAGKPPQFSMGKSVDTFGPLGPGVVPLDQLDDPNDLAISCTVSGHLMQDSRTTLMVFPVPELITFLSRYCTLTPGDLIFTGTPAGVGSVRNPRRYLEKGDVITSRIEGVGTLTNPCVEGAF